MAAAILSRGDESKDDDGLWAFFSNGLRDHVKFRGILECKKQPNLLFLKKVNERKSNKQNSRQSFCWI